jgi:adenylate kinase family enzyme
VDTGLNVVGYAMARIVIIGNAAGGKSTLARTLAGHRDLRLIEIDRLLWQPGWKLTPADEYTREHDELIGLESWIIEGLGQQDSIPRRLTRATEIVLVDLPLWLHYALAADRQLAWAQGTAEGAPAGATAPPPTRGLFETMWRVDRDWMPGIRDQCAQAEGYGKLVIRVSSLKELDAFSGIA